MDGLGLFEIHQSLECLVAEAPKILPHRAAMTQTLSKLTGHPHHAISVKATTSEGMGFVGHKEGLAAHAVVSIALPVTKA